MKGGVNRVWAQLMVEELVRCGIDTFCLASGYRNAPLAIAAVEHPRTKVVTHFDERGAAFFAVGFARATGRAAGWITTSGTAVANGLPAVIEADADEVPLLLLTADRPPELRRTRANQAIRQAGIFEPHVRWSFDVPPPSESVPPAFVLTSVDQACFRLRAPTQGPVHLNCMFRAPLVCEARADARYLEPLQAWLASERPYTIYEAAPESESASHIAAMLQAVPRVLMVIGRLKHRHAAEAALALASAARWPVFADINSQVRLGVGPEVRIDAFEMCLGSDAFAGAHAPQAVLYVGAPAVSGVLARYLARHRPHPFIVVDGSPRRQDPGHNVSLRVHQDAGAACRAIRAALDQGATGDAGWLGRWQRAGARARKVLDGELAGGGRLTEPFVARALTQLIPKGHGLVVGNSMPVRDLDCFGAATGARPPVAANRGASGIDGTIGMAAGAAVGWSAPATVVLGDLALLHDVNSLALLDRHALTIVVVNNDGGGIFHMVEIETSHETFERCFGTPHGLHFEHAARMFGLDYSRVTSREDFRAVYSRACADGRSTIIEVCTDRNENRAYHAALQARAAAAAASINPGNL